VTTVLVTHHSPEYGVAVEFYLYARKMDEAYIRDGKRDGLLPPVDVDVVGAA
jgi:hypothetical protein